MVQLPVCLENAGVVECLEVFLHNTAERRNNCGRVFTERVLCSASRRLLFLLTCELNTDNEDSQVRRDKEDRPRAGRISGSGHIVCPHNTHQRDFVHLKT